MANKLLVINAESYMEVPLDQQLTIGRDVFNSLSLQDAEVSRTHAIIFGQGDQTIIKDLNSRNGVFVNGDRVAEQALQNGDEIILGSTILFFNPPEGLDLERALSRRGEYLFHRRAGQRPALSTEPVTVFPAGQMESVIHRLLHDPEGATFFTLPNAIELLRAFYEMGAATDSTDLFSATLRHALRILGGDHGVVMEADPAKERLKVLALESPEGEEASIEIAQAVLRVVLGAEKCVFCPNVLNDNRFARIAARGKYPIHSFVACPILAGRQYFGFIYLDSQDRRKGYDYVGLRSLYFMASHLGALLQPRATHFAHEALVGGEGS